MSDKKSEAEQGEDGLIYKGVPIEELEKPELLEAVYWLYRRMKDDERTKEKYLDIMGKS